VIYIAKVKFYVTLLLQTSCARLKYCLRAKVLIFIMIIPIFLTQQSESVLSASQCWSSSELETKNGEQKILLGSEKALVDTPGGEVQTVASPFNWHGVLRRVDLPIDNKLIALTFDFCEQPHEVAGYQGHIVDYLRKNNIKATFFFGGKWVLTHEERSQQLMSDPLFEIGSHSWEHKNFRVLDTQTAMNDEVKRPLLAFRDVRQRLVRRACLRDGRPAHASIPQHTTLFRFPFGACTSSALQTVENFGLRAIQWDVSSGDPSPNLSVATMVKDVVARVRPGSIVLFHANGRGWHTSEAIPIIVSQLAAQGYKFATVSDMLSAPGAHPVLTQSCYDETPGDTDRYDRLARILEGKHRDAVSKISTRKAHIAH
jgi:peptidoglycan/xylan/chitin deacetylase (PgdA/CDA1 family)